MTTRLRKQPPQPLGPVTAADIVAFIEQVCFVPEGKLVGKPLKLEEWQKDILRLIYDNPAGTRHAIISMPRKNAKSSLAACLLLAHLCGPPAKRQPNSQLYSTAQSRDQAAIVFALMTKMIQMNPVLLEAVKIQETAKTIVCGELGTKYRALSAEATTAHGLSPSLVVHDELGRVRGPRSALFEAMETATAAQANPLSIIISTQAANDSDLLSLLIDDAREGADPHTVVKLYTAPPELDPFSEEALQSANPALNTFMNAEEVRGMADAARRMPSRQAEYENLVLNRRVEVSSPFINATLWTACAGEPKDFTGLDAFAGLDLSQRGDMTALILAHCDPTDGVWHVRPIFWVPSEGLFERARTDKAPYDLWVTQGHIETTPGASISLEFIAERLKDTFDDFNIRKLAFDKWNFEALKPWLLKVGFSEMTLKDKFLAFGQSYRSMSPALRDLEGKILDKKIRHGGHPVLQMNVANAVIETDALGNRRLAKKKATGRIDGVSGLAMCIGAAPAAMTAKIDVAALIGAAALWLSAIGFAGSYFGGA